MQYLTTLLAHLQPGADDDIVDRLNYYYTGTIMVVFALLVSAKQYVGYPIQCWVPAHFTEAMEQYTENYCWVQNTWWLELEKDVPRQLYSREQREIVYYQWVPFILSFEAMLFYLPCFFWRLLNWQSGINIADIVQLAKDSRTKSDPMSRARAVATAAHYLEDALVAQKSRLERLRDTPKIYSQGKSRTKREFYVTSLYFGIKLAYSMNLLFQYFLLDYCLGTKHILFGPYMLHSLITGRQGYQWQESGLFPRTTLCDFEVKVLGNLHRHTVQCVLMINMFNEKVFLFLWFWFAVLFLLTIASIFYWLFILLLPSRRRRFVLKYMNLSLLDTHEIDKSDLNGFIFSYLNIDGILVLRLISIHAGDIVLSELVCDLWFSFIQKTALRRKENIFLASLGETDQDGTAVMNGNLRPFYGIEAGNEEEEDEEPEKKRKVFKSKGYGKSDIGKRTSQMGDRVWASSGSRVLQSKVMAGIPIYRQEKFVRQEKLKCHF